jgi:hypothetical protein
MEYVLLIIGLLCVAASGVSEAVMDKLQFHYDKSIFSNEKYKQTFWNPNLSWVNKWKDSSAREEKFSGSSTLFVFTTDAWHLFKFFKNTLIFIGLPLIAVGPMNFILAAAIARVLYGIVFTIFFDKILVKS